MTGKRGLVDIENTYESTGLKIQNGSKIIGFPDPESMDEPIQKRQKSETQSKGHIRLSTDNHEEDEDQLDQQIEKEEKNADNLVIKDLMGSVKPESNKVNLKFCFF